MQNANFDNGELSENHKSILSERLEIYAKDGNKGKPYQKGAFDKFFGILQSDKSISPNDMNNAIKLRGGQLTD